MPLRLAFAARWGVVAAVLAAFVAFAAAQHALRLPGFSYSWLRPPRTAYQIVRSETFPSVALVVMLLGLDWRAARLREVVANLRGDARPYLGPALRRLAAGLVALLIASRLSQAFSVFDLFAILVFGASIDVPTRAGSAWPRAFVTTALFSLGALTLVSYGFTVMKALVFVLGRPLDAVVTGFESRLFGADPSAVVAAWASHRAWAVSLSDWVYYHTFHHLLLQVVFLAALGDRDERARYIAAMSMCYVVGAFAYHIMPTAGPIYASPARYGYLAQWAPLTTEYRALLSEHVERVTSGGRGELVSYEYIAAMPSLHIAQEAVMAFYSRRSRAMFACSIVFLSAMSFAVVVLGWHAPTDVVFGLLLAASAIAMTNVLLELGERWFRRRA